MTVEDRLEKLEQELAAAKHRNRRLLAVVVTAFAVLGVAWMWTAAMPAAQAQGADAVPKVVRAGKFVLEDENGKTRAELAMFTLGPRLRLYDENGKVRAALAVSKDEAQLGLLDENSKGGAALFATKDGPRLDLLDENGKHRAELFATKDGPALRLLDETGKTIWSAP